MPIKEFKMKTEDITNISFRFESFCAADLELKAKAERVSYYRSKSMLLEVKTLDVN